MSIDLGSPVIDLAVGLSFIFFLGATIVSAGTEMISWAFQHRAANLKRGLRNMLHDETTANSVLDHPLITVGVKKSGGKPAYISARNFSLVFLDVFAPADGQGNVLERAKAKVEQLAHSPLKTELGTLVDAAEDDVSKFRKSIEYWFDDTMDRVSGWYRRWAQWWTIVLAIVVAIGLNVDAIRVANRLADDATVRTAVANAGQQASTGTTPTAPANPKAAGEQAQTAVNKLNALNLPIGWAAANSHINVATIAGWALTAIALSLGAPFWFDALGKLARLRTTGAKPPKS